MKYFPLALLFLFFAWAHSAKGPQYHSLRVHGMGGAFIAVADNKDALYYNPAGLDLITGLGNFEKNPDMGYMPSPKRYNVSLVHPTLFIPVEEFNDMIGICGGPTFGKIIKKSASLDFGRFGDLYWWCPDYKQDYKSNGEPYTWREYLDSMETILDERMRKIDRRKMEMDVQLSILELVVPHFGIAAWLNAYVAPYMDYGLMIPTFGYDPIQADLVVQTATGFSPVEKWSVGVGLKFAKRYRQSAYEFKPDLELNRYDELPTMGREDIDSLEKMWENFGNDVLDAKLAIGLDLGVLYQITRQIRLGTSVRNIFFDELAGESITPNWSIGAMTSPMLLQSNSLFERKVNFAIDYVDILDGTITDMFFSHLNFGAEIDQVVIPSPTKGMSFGYTALFGLVGGIAGLGIGTAIGSNYGTIGTFVGMGLGGIAGFKFGSGSDALRVSLGGGYEGGYPAFNVAVGVLETFSVRFGSYAEERGLRTGQNGHRFWATEITIGF